MITEGDIAAVRDLRDLLEPARSGDRATAAQLRRALKWTKARLDEQPLAHLVDAWAADRGLPETSLPELVDSGLPLLALEMGWRRAAQAARPEPPAVDAVIDAAHAADAAMLGAIKQAKTVCRHTLNELNLTEIPEIGTAIMVGRRRLQLVAVSPAGRLTWRDPRSGELFTSAKTGRLRRTGPAR